MPTVPEISQTLFQEKLIEFNPDISRAKNYPQSFSCKWHRVACEPHGINEKYFKMVGLL